MRWIYTDLSPDYMDKDFQTFKYFLHSTIQSCITVNVGHTFVSNTYDPDTHNSTLGMSCCNDADCGIQLGEISEEQYFRPYPSDDLVIEDDSDFIYRYTKAWYDEVKALEHACKYNSFIFITNRIVNTTAAPKLGDIKGFFHQRFNLKCTQPAIILVGRPAEAIEDLKLHYEEITENLFVVPNPRCLSELAACLQPCVSDLKKCDLTKLDLVNCTEPNHTDPTPTQAPPVTLPPNVRL